MTAEECCIAYFAALNGRDWDALAAIVTDDVVYGLRGSTSPLPQRVSGKDAFLQMTREVFAHFEGARFENIEVSKLSLALTMFVVDYDGSWQGRVGAPRKEHGRVVFEMRDARIARITVLVGDAMALIAEDFGDELS